MISIIITSFNEPKTIEKAIESFLSQNIKEKYELIVCAPDSETLNIAKKYKKVKIFKDPGKGKSYALNLLIPKLKGKIVILSDGDVFVGKDSVNKILEKFKNKNIGCVSGKPISQDSRDTLFGYWSHVLFNAADKLRLKNYKQGKFLECSGYLWAFKNKIIKKFPVGASEDSIVPVLFWKNGYKIAYSQESEVYVKNPSNLHDFVEQKKRNIKGHEILEKYVKNIPRMKSIKNEITNSYTLLLYPKNIKEIFYTLLLFPLRLYIWMLTFYHIKIKKQGYKDGWKRVESTK